MVAHTDHGVLHHDGAGCPAEGDMDASPAANSSTTSSFV
jgi:hypothetical protein